MPGGPLFRWGTVPRDSGWASPGRGSRGRPGRHDAFTQWRITFRSSVLRAGERGRILSRQLPSPAVIPYVEVASHGTLGTCRKDIEPIPFPVFFVLLGRERSR
ncbi:hypothetical protein TVNIR_1288 [Thioalkalivibrio nitratireducens DSM 14787]|uniref:Uncharacterized protein n=1 Tax=Thioalkalivibrio nitratireducens (strain DSM 14787 / UNIQEM 213 / ALEN2) TaxID=1255043 RepID=L0DX90_THIND|nr:hypothetical protein TVNIR_1288 [Thioalkalivibrio nitratireducens DSM 14787]